METKKEGPGSVSVRGRDSPCPAKQTICQLYPKRLFWHESVGALKEGAPLPLAHFQLASSLQ